MPGRASTLMDDCLRAGKPSLYAISRQVNSTFHPSGVGKTSTNLSAWG